MAIPKDILIKKQHRSLRKYSSRMEGQVYMKENKKRVQKNRNSNQKKAQKNPGK